MPSYDVATNIWQAVGLGVSRAPPPPFANVLTALVNLQESDDATAAGPP
jgi:hypothetical protein